MNKEYLPRIIDDVIDEYLKVFGAVLVVGPKWCGKTTTSENLAKTVIKLQDPRKGKNYEKMIDIEPSAIMKGEIPLLIDEWQTNPIIWDAVRSEVDERGEAGQFILTGSAVPVDEGIMHTGTGRIARIKMYPMSLYESNDSNGKISLEELFNGKTDINGIESNMDIEKLIYVICRGGWPATVGIDTKGALLVAENYVNAICESDISRIDSSYKNPRRIRAILASYARNTSTLATKSTIRRDVIANDQNISETTFFQYLNLLERLYVIEDVPAWSPAIRSKTAIRLSVKNEFVDPSLAVAALGLGPNNLLEDMNTLGFMFENLAIRDLKIYSQKLGGQISYYHDRYGLECDAVLHLKDGQFALIEMKLGSKEIDEGAEHLIEMKALLEKNKMKAPTCLMILTGGQFAYKREDGVLVVPIGCLKD